MSIFLQNVLYKILFTTNFVGNTCEFYNFEGNNYPRRNYIPIKILRKNSKKKSFLANFFNKFAICKKIPCNMRIFSSGRTRCIYLGVMGCVGNPTLTRNKTIL